MWTSYWTGKQGGVSVMWSYHLWLNKGSNDNIGREKAKEYGVIRVPSVAVDAKLLECCKIGTVSEQALRDAGVDQP